MDMRKPTYIIAGHYTQDGIKKGSKWIYVRASEVSFRNPKTRALNSTTFSRIDHTTPATSSSIPFSARAPLRRWRTRWGAAISALKWASTPLRIASLACKKSLTGNKGGISKSAGWQGGGGFRFYRLGPTVFDEQGHIRQDIRFPTLAAHVWFSETRRPWNGKGDSPLLGLCDDHAYALLYNGILGDKRPAGGNVLTRSTLARIRDEISSEYKMISTAH